MYISSISAVKKGKYIETFLDITDQQKV